MIIHVPFTQAVRLYSIAVDAPEGSRPTCIKLFANKPISFDDVDVMTPAQVRWKLLILIIIDYPYVHNFMQILNLKEEEFGDDVQIRLNMAKLGTVHSINVFFENENGELVAVKYLSFFGYPVQGTNISELKPMKDA